MKNITINAWACWSEDGTIDILSTRKLAYEAKKELDEFDFDGLKVSKCKIIIQNENKTRYNKKNNRSGTRR
jgi:hypothetical protein